MLYIDGDYAFTQPVKHLTALKIDSPGHSFDFVWLCNMRNEGCHWYKKYLFLDWVNICQQTMYLRAARTNGLDCY